MNIVKKLTLRHLKENKSRSVVTTLGICVSVAMITAVFVAAYSLMNLLGDLTILQNGSWHGSAESVGAQTVEKLENDPRIDKVGLSLHGTDNAGYILNDDLTVKSGIGITVGNNNLFDMLVKCKYQGRLPQNDSEIIINKDILEKYFPDAALGRTITFFVPDRKSEDSENVGISFNNKNTVKYTVVGIMEKNYPAECLRTASDSEIAKCLKEKNAVVSFTLKSLNFKSNQELNDIAKEYKLNESFCINTDLLMSNFSFDKDSYAFTAILPLCAVCLVIIIIASVMLIYNAFGMSLSERVRYLGMLASVGATKKQKRGSVYFEGILIGAIGIPIGIVAGFIGIAITLRLVGDKVISSGVLSEAARMSGIKFNATINPIIILLIIFFSALTIFISLYIPAKKASGITPIDAIRQKDDFKLKAKKIRSPRLIRAVFGYEGEIANKSLKRNRRKTNMITASIALSVILFLCVNYFCQMFVESNKYMADIPYELTVTVDYEKRELLKKDLLQLKGVESVFPVNCSFETLNLNDENSKDSPFLNADNYKAAYKDVVSDYIFVYYNAISDADFNRLCKENNLDSDRFYNREKLSGVILDDLRRSEASGKIFKSSIMNGEKSFEADSPESGSSEVAYTIGGIVKYDSKNYACNLNPKGAVSLYFPESEYFKALDNISQGNSDDNGRFYSFAIATNEHKAVYEQLEGLSSKSNNYSELMYSDLAEQSQMLNSLVFALQVFVYGFITLITMIAIANIINTVSTGIMMRRKEFAMLKSVGTTPKGFRKMICLESFFYGAKALLFAYPISLALSYLMNRTIGQDSMPFVPDVWMYLASAAAVFIIVGISMYYSVRKLKGDSIVETLKTEIN